MKRDSAPVVIVPDALKSNAVKPPFDRRLESSLRPDPLVGLVERSLFHQPWWLDATAGEDWHMAVVKSGDQIIGEMPYTLTKKGLWQVSYLPPVTRTLGPVIKRQSAHAGGPEWLHRLDVTRELIAQLPRCAHFQQLADPLVSEAEAAAFALAGFKVSVQFTLKLPAGLDEETVWSRLRRNTRNHVRRSSERFVIQPITDVDAFVSFYDSNLSARELDNIYGSTIMRRLLTEVLKHEAGTLLGSFDSDGSLTAATALVWDRANLYYILATRKATAHSGAVALLIWQAMKIARERGVEFDFDGVSTAGILQFLSGFGGQLVRRYQFEYMRADFALIRGARARTREFIKSTRKRDAEKNAPVE